VTKFTFLIDLGTEQRTVTWSGPDEEYAKELAWAGLPDADKAKLKSITLVTTRPAS
jgi:hypothetical protein